LSGFWLPQAFNSRHRVAVHDAVLVSHREDAGEHLEVAVDGRRGEGALVPAVGLAQLALELLDEHRRDVPDRPLAEELFDLSYPLLVVLPTPLILTRPGQEHAVNELREARDGGSAVVLSVKDRLPNLSLNLLGLLLGLRLGYSLLDAVAAQVKLDDPRAAVPVRIGRLDPFTVVAFV